MDRPITDSQGTAGIESLWRTEVQETSQLRETSDKLTSVFKPYVKGRQTDVAVLKHSTKKQSFALT